MGPREDAVPEAKTRVAKTGLPMAEPRAIVKGGTGWVRKLPHLELDYLGVRRAATRKAFPCKRRSSPSGDAPRAQIEVSDLTGGAARGHPPGGLRGPLPTFSRPPPASQCSDQRRPALTRPGTGPLRTCVPVPGTGTGYSTVSLNQTTVPVPVPGMGTRYLVFWVIFKFPYLVL